MSPPRLQKILRRTEAALATPSRTPRTAVVLGRLLGAAFLICFLTGLYSHFLQNPLPWMVFPTKPVWLYQVTQGTHIVAGIICLPLLLGKLYTVFPALFQSPPVRSLTHLLERGSIAVFVSASIVEISIGLLNTYQFYALFPFSFRRVHYVLSFLIIGSLLLHIAIKLPAIVRFWRRARPPAVSPDADAPSTDTSRRGFFITIAVAAGSLVLFTAGQSIPALRPFALFAPRLPGTGPQGLPVNHTAESAGVVGSASAADWTLTVSHGESSASFTRAALAAMPQTEAVIPLACVEGWSQSARWRGVRLRDLVDQVGAPEHATVRVRSLQERSAYTVMIMPREFVRDDDTLIALELDGQTLDLDHGYPARIICPARPGVLQTKWLTSIEVLA